MAKTVSVGEQTKKFLGDYAQRIALHDLVVAKTREVVAVIAEHQIPNQARWSAEELQEQLQWFEDATSELRTMESLIAYWGDPHHRQTLVLPVARLAGDPVAASSSSGRHPLDWYPVLLAAYCIGIAAVAAGRYDNLVNMLHASIAAPIHWHSDSRLGLLMIDGTANLVKALKILPEHKNQHVPRSEHLFTLLQQELDELFYLEGNYETYFDRFEVLLALEYAHMDTLGGRARVWGPPGRFAWKLRREVASSPFHRITAEAEAQGDAWPPIRAGLFGGSAQRFQEISALFADWIAGAGWY